jgi:hypothetical protein
VQVEVIDELQGRLRSALMDLEGRYADDLLHDRLSEVLDTVSCSWGDDVQLARTCAASPGPDSADHEDHRQHCVQRQSQRGRAFELHHASALSHLHYTEETTEAAALTPDMRGGVSQTEFPKGWTQLQETAYQKLIAAGTKQFMTTDLVRKSLKGEHGEKPSEIHQKSHIVDCELVVEALKKMRGPIPGRQYFAYLAETLQQEDNWRWLKDIKNQVNDHVVVKKVLSGEKVKLSPHETSKVAKQVAFLLNNMDKLPRALVKSMVEVLDKAYEEKTGKKILDRRKFPETSTPSLSKDSDRQQQQERERARQHQQERERAERQRQQALELARQQQQERERAERQRQQVLELACQQQQERERVEAARQQQERAQNPWNVFQHVHAGLGYSPSQMSAAYHRGDGGSHGDGFRGSACYAVSSQQPHGPHEGGRHT